MYNNKSRQRLPIKIYIIQSIITFNGEMKESLAVGAVQSKAEPVVGEGYLDIAQYGHSRLGTTLSRHEHHIHGRARNLSNVHNYTYM